MTGLSDLLKTGDGILPGDIERQIERLRESGWAELSADRRAFAIAYIETMSHAEAAKKIKKAGQGMKYMRDPKVLALIQDLQDEMAKYNALTAHWVRVKSMELYEKLSGDVEVPMVTAQGQTFTAKKFHSGESVSLLRDIGKQAGMYADQSTLKLQALDKNGMPADFPKFERVIIDASPEDTTDTDS